jgi:hypothetical protein
MLPAILVVFLIVLLYLSTYALNKRYPMPDEAIDSELLGKCIACPISVCGMKERLHSDEVKT